MDFEKVVVVGASAGGIEALSEVAKGLPAHLEAPVLVVMHIAPDSPGYLPEILSKRGALRAKNAEDGETLRAGRIYVAPPDRHLIVEADGHVRTPRGPRENRSRPAVDPLFRSAALAFGTRAIGVILSGGLDDGAAGLRGIKMCGGTTIVQDPEDAIVNSMPLSALRSASVDYCRPAIQLGPLIARCVAEPIGAAPSLEPDMRKQMETEIAIARDSSQGASIREFGSPSLFTCPECHGALVKLRSERPAQFRCHTGHAFTADTLLAELNEATDQAIWNAVRSEQEKAMLLGHIADHWQEIDAPTAGTYRERAKIAMSRADHLRRAAKITVADEPRAEDVARE